MKTKLKFIKAIVFQTMLTTGIIAQTTIGQFTFINGNYTDDLNGSAMAANGTPSDTSDRFSNNNMALSFNGVTDAVAAVSPGSNLMFNVYNQISISCWINPTSVSNPNLQTIAARWTGQTATEQFGMFQSGNGIVLAVRSVNSAGVTIPNLFPTANTWYHLVFTYDKINNNRHCLYVNGVQVYNNTFAGTYTNSTGNSYFSIGAQLDGSSNLSRFFQGKIDDFRFYDGLLSASEVNDLFNEQNPANALIAKYSFDNGTTEDDYNFLNLKKLNTPQLTTDRFGNASKAWQFNTNEGLYLLNTGGMNLNTLDEISISCWVNPYNNVSTALQALVVRWGMNGGIEQYGIWQSGTSMIIGARDITSGGVTIPNIFTSSPAWYHVVFTYSKTDNNRHKVYVNNVEVYNNTFAGSCSLGNLNSFFSVGVETDASLQHYRYFFGKIDDIHVFNKALNAQTVDSLFNQPNPVSVNEYMQADNKLQLYPNPAQNQLHIACNEKGTINLFSVDGKCISTKVTEQGNLEFWIGDLNPGMYFIELINQEGKHYRQKFIKE